MARASGAIGRRRILRAPGAALGLLGALLGAIGPARGGEAPAPAGVVAELSAYVPDGATGVVAVRPAALLGRLGRDRVAPLAAFGVREVLNPWLGEKLHADLGKPGFRTLAPAEIEAILLSLEVREMEAGRVAFASQHVVVRSVAPLDWPGLLRQWGFEVAEVRGARATTYKVKMPPGTWLRARFVAYQPDERTVVFDGDGGKWVEELIRRDAPAVPAWLRGEDWREAGRGLASLVVDHRDVRLAPLLVQGLKAEKIDWEDLLISLVAFGAERWVASLVDADELGGYVEARVPTPLAANVLGLGLGKALGIARQEFAALARVDPEVARAALDDEIPGLTDAEKANVRRLAAAELRVERLAADATARLRVEARGRSVRIGSAGFGTYAEVGRFLLFAVAELVDFKDATKFLDEPVPPAARP